MNRQDAKSAKKKEPDPELDEWAHKAIGAAIEVHRVLGPGYLESVYEEALAIEFELRKIPYERQKSLHVFYKIRNVHEGRVDFVVAARLLVEIKAVDELAPIHKAIVISYLRAAKQPLALLINFNVPVLRDGLQRVIFT